MKTIFFATLLAVASLAVLPAENDSAHGNKYCAKMKDGVLRVMHEGTIVNSTVTLNNGTVLHADGQIVYKNGTRKQLEAGQCISRDGKIMNKDNNKKSKY
ncbi:MAG TPA: DUF6799 domain-containing protein [Flavobacteriales bacterium]|nr:DUF6799 domain-containing protein [Flavobacteriales bacterium]